MLVGAVLISTSPVFVKAIRTDAMGPAAIGLYRAAVGAVVLALVTRASGRSLRMRRGGLAVVLLAGAFFAGDLYCWHKSIVLVGAGMSTILANTEVVWVALFGTLVLAEPGGLRLWAAVALAVGGVVLLSGVLSPEGVPRMDPGGLAWGIAAGILYAGFLLGMRAAGRREDRGSSAAALVWASIATAGVLALLALLTGESVAIPDAGTGVLLVALGVVVQGAGWWIITAAVPKIPAAWAGLLLLLQPTLSTLWGALFFGERLTALEVAGAVAVLVALHLGATKPRAPRGARAAEDGHGGPETSEGSP